MFPQYNGITTETMIITMVTHGTIDKKCVNTQKMSQTPRLVCD